jgi:TonB-linked SusC/RagA family outer membrane protein
MKKSLTQKRLYYQIVSKSMQQLFLAILFSGLVIGAPVIGQNILDKKISFRAEDISLETALKQLEAAEKVKFSYNSRTIPLKKKVQVNLKNEPFSVVLNHLLTPLDITYKEVGSQIVLIKTERNASEVTVPAEPNVTEDSRHNADRTISGIVRDESGEALPGVSIIAKGSQRGTISDIEGKFSMDIPDGPAILVFSFVGYLNQEINISNQSTLEVKLLTDTKSLEEVVVVGYGTVKKSDLTGAVSEVSAKAIKDLPVASIDQKLVGQVAGVQIQQVSGAPGAGTSVKIRGSGSLGAGNEPLYVIDGMPYSSGLNQNINPLTFINPNDIDKITILKDASSTAIYGSRGANGVIMITTKNPGKNTSQVNFSSYAGLQSVPQRGRPEMLNAREFAEYQRDRINYVVRTREKRAATIEDYPEAYRDLDKLNNTGTNWYDLILQTAFIQDHNFDIQKGMEKSRLNFGFGYFSQEGTIKHTGIKRYSANFGFQSEILKNVTLQASVRPTFIDQNRAQTGAGRDPDVTGISLWANPVMTPYDEQGNIKPYITTPASIYNSTWSFANPLYILEQSKRNYQELRNLGNAALEWAPIENLKLRSAISTVVSVSQYKPYLPSTIGGSNNPPAPGRGASNRSFGNSFNWLIENTASYSKTLENHNLSILAGYTTQKSKGNGVNLNAGPYANDLIETINAAPGITGWGESVDTWSMISYLGRLNYSYKDRYLFTATLRSDGSSRFGTSNRFALFPSAAIAWKLSDEEFIKAIPAIDHLKLRASYGKSGNNNIGNYSHLSNVNMGQYVFNNNTVSAATVSLFNPFLGWEESEQFDLGLETALFKGKLSVTADLYHRKSVNMLLNDVIPAITGFNNQLVNKGSVRNRGLELGIDATPVSGQLTWDINFNVAFNRNKILATNENGDRILSGSMDSRPTNVSIVGKPIGQFYGFVLEGVYSQADIDNPAVAKYPGATAGYPRYRDLNGDGTVNEMIDYQDLGSPHPDFIYGLSNRVNYKNFDLAVNVNGQYGGYVMNGMRQTTDNLQGFFNIGKEWVNRWRSDENPGDGIHAFGPNSVHRVNDKIWLEDASYLRITNMTLGYTIPSDVFGQKRYYRNLRVYMSVQNLATFTKYTGANPEGQASNMDNTLVPGYDMGSYPIPRTVTAGINIQF